MLRALFNRNMTMANMTSTELKDFEVELCRTGVGFTTVRVRAGDAFLAGLQAMEQAGDQTYSEKSATYELVNPVVVPDDSRVMRLILELEPEVELHQPRPARAAEIMVDRMLLDKLTRMETLSRTESLNEVTFRACPIWRHDGLDAIDQGVDDEIGRASCRERV